MSDEKWVTLTPEQVEALEQGVIVRAHRGDTMVEGPLDNVSADGTCVGIGSQAWSRIYVGGPIEVREADAPEFDPTTLKVGDRVSYRIGDSSKTRTATLADDGTGWLVGMGADSHAIRDAEGSLLEYVRDLRLVEAAPEGDPWALVHVSVRRDDLKELHEAWDDRRWLDSGVHRRIRAALRGETR